MEKNNVAQSIAARRGGAKQLANHILRGEENEHVEVHEVRGFTTDNPNLAFQEMYALSRGTECRQFMFSLSLSPPLDAMVPPEHFENALNNIEKELGLQDQARVVVFHEKEGRRHAHCVWSRIDVQEMKAINLPWFKNKLNDISRQLYLEHGWDLPKGYIDRRFSDPANFGLEEWQQAKRAKEDPKLLKRLFTQTWAASDSKQAFAQALKEYGFILARGDRRGYLAVDYNGKEYSLSRWAGVKTKELKARLGDPASLPSVDEAKAEFGRSMTQMLEKHLDQLRQEAQERLRPVKRAVQTMRAQHHAERQKLQQAQKSRWETEEQQRTARLPRGIKGIWHRITGKYQQVRDFNEQETSRANERDKAEKHELIIRQLKERQKLQQHVQKLRHERNEAMLAVRLDIGRYLEMQGKEAPELTQLFNRQPKPRNEPGFNPEL